MLKCCFLVFLKIQAFQQKCLVFSFLKIKTYMKNHFYLKPKEVLCFLKRGMVFFFFKIKMQVYDLKKNKEMRVLWDMLCIMLYPLKFTLIMLLFRCFHFLWMALLWNIFASHYRFHYTNNCILLVTLNCFH